MARPCQPNCVCHYLLCVPQKSSVTQQLAWIHAGLIAKLKGSLDPSTSRCPAWAMAMQCPADHQEADVFDDLLTGLSESWDKQAGNESSGKLSKQIAGETQVVYACHGLNAGAASYTTTGHVFCLLVECICHAASVRKTRQRACSAS